MRTFVASAKSADSRWHVIDAKGQVLGRVATLAAKLLQGKHKAVYTPFIDTGDHVVVVNAAQVKLTGRKEEQKIYRRHSGYEGGLREERASVVRKRQPIRLVEEAVRGMLPKTKMGDAMYRKLKVYAGPGSSARGPATAEDRGRVIWPASNTTQQDAARLPPPACSFAPARAPSPSTTESSSSSSRPMRCGRRCADRCCSRRRATSSTSWRRWPAAASTVRRARCASALRARSCEFNAELRRQLKKDGLLTSDSRVKERKKYGLAGARKRFQFSKR